MNPTMPRTLIRFAAAPVAVAGILGGALGLAGVANASTVADAPTSCAYTGSATLCQTPGNAQIDIEPDSAPEYAAQQYPIFGYGYEGGLLFHDRRTR